jgi:uncharacterized protein (TIGR02118 family)
MIKVSVLYPYTGGAAFDMNYYLTKHIPMVREKLGAACKGASVEHGIAGGAPGTSPTYIAMGHLLFESVEAFQAAFGPHTAEIVGDVPNYTPIEPILQISEVKIS